MGGYFFALISLSILSNTISISKKYSNSMHITPLSRSDKPPFAGLSSCYEVVLYGFVLQNSTEIRYQTADIRAEAVGERN